MIDPKNGGRDSESPTSVPDGGSVPAPVLRGGPQVLSSDANTIASPEPLAEDTPAMIGHAQLTLASSDAPTLLDVRVVGGFPPSKPASTISQLPGLLPGTMLGGRYQILQMIGEGGMGAVYKAKDRELDRFVALKVIRRDLASNAAIVARFKQELLLSHQVTHKNVIRIYDLADADGVKFITMEFIEGADLRRLLIEHGKFT